MTTYVGYIRVSTAKQGEHGVSLQEQRDAITRFAERKSLEISRWFEERETAAKRGRPVFNAMMKLLRSGKANGVLIHKIDRSARNMKDWADLGELIDQGIEVHFVNESLDLASRGGRLSADIQAAVAADYVRNLRDETRKGFYGRLKQGFYPLPAPLGYKDMGKAKAKEFDPLRAPLVRKGFELYSTGRWTLEGLRAELNNLGLRSRYGGNITRGALSLILNNPFYVGLIRLARTGEVFRGVHEPLITKSLFDRVQLVLRGKVGAKVNTHEFQFRRVITCSTCQHVLSGELQKGHVYYRCHSQECPTTSVREEVIDSAFTSAFEPLCFDDEEQEILAEALVKMRDDFTAQWEAELKAMNLHLGQVRERLDRLTDAYIDRLIDRDVFDARKASILMEEKSLQEKISQPRQVVVDRLTKFFELTGDAYLLYKTSLPSEKRDLLRMTTSNRLLSGKNVAITLKPPLSDVANRCDFSNGGPSRDRLRTIQTLVQKVADWFMENPTEEFDTSSIRDANHAENEELSVKRAAGLEGPKPRIYFRSPPGGTAAA